MSRNYVWILAILASVLFGFLLAWAGSDGSMQIYGLPLFFYFGGLRLSYSVDFLRPLFSFSDREIF